MSLFQNNKIDIWFTMGPASSHSDVIKKIVEEGATGVRLTFSYGTPQIQIQRAEMVTNSAKEVGKTCKIIADLAGEKIRLGEFGKSNHLAVKEGERLQIVSSKFDFENKIIPLNSEDFIDRVVEGDNLIVGDGSVILSIVEKQDNGLLCEVTKGGVINPNRGVIAQSDSFQPACLTSKDLDDLDEIIKSDSFDAVALSFVSNARDVLRVREILEKSHVNIPIISKIETRQGVENASSIASASDAVMVARGDLALFSPWQELGNMTEQIVAQVKNAQKPWIMATQLVEGLERFVFPTRPEICDLTRWAKEGASAFLLSYETAFGPRPVDAVYCVNEILSACKYTKQERRPQ